jgi:hypothetical protein
MEQVWRRRCRQDSDRFVLGGQLKSPYAINGLSAYDYGSIDDS